MSRRRHAQPAHDDPDQGLDRLQKILAAAGIGSRRECEALITAGRVEVDGEFVTELGRKVDPTAHRIQVDGVTLPKPRRVYFALNKPVGVVSTNSDPDGRPRVIDLINSNERLYPVGRLDRTSEGLILVTNDGELANRLTHPRFGVEKVYRVRVVGSPAAEDLAKIRKGIYLSDGLARVSSIRTKRRFKQSTELEIVLQEGLNREIRRLLARIGHKVVQLKRIAIGPIRLGTMPVGAHRMLGRDEVQALRRATRRRKKSGETAERSGGRRSGRSGVAPAGGKADAKAGESRGGGRPSRSRADADAESDQPRRRKSGSSALGGYTRPTKNSAGRARLSGSNAAGRTTARPDKKAVKKKAAKKKTVRKKTARTKATDKPAGTVGGKKSGTKSTRPPKPRTGKKPAGRPGSKAGKKKPAGKKKSGRKRR